MFVLATLKKSTKPPSHPFGSGQTGDRPRGQRFVGDRPRFGGREGYRGAPRGGPPGEFGGEKGGALPEFQLSFRGSSGRPGFGRDEGSFGGGPGASSWSKF